MATDNLLSRADFEKRLRKLKDGSGAGGRAEDAFHVVCPALPGYGYLKVDTTVYTRFRSGYVSGPSAQVVRAPVADVRPRPLLVPVYNGVKAGVIEFSEALDAELESQGVRVSAVLPTFTRTGLISGLRTTAVVKVIEPESVARIIMKTVARPRVRVAAPRSMGWVHGNAMIPAGIKRRIRRVTGLGNSFLDYDADARAGYSRRIAQ